MDDTFHIPFLNIEPNIYPTLTTLTADLCRAQFIVNVGNLRKWDLLAVWKRDKKVTHILDGTTVCFVMTYHQVEPTFVFINHRSEEHTSELQSLMRISYAVFCLKQQKQKINQDSKYRFILNSNTTHQSTSN